MESLEMLALDSPRWRDLSHAYGPGDDVPEMIRAISNEARHDVEAWEGSQAWDFLWGALCHQGTVYSATVATIPHLVEICEKRALVDRGALLIYVAAVVGGHRVAFDGDLEAAFAQAVDRARSWSLAVLQAARPGNAHEAAALAEAFVVLRHPQSACAVSLSSLVDGELDAQCPRCNRSWIVLMAEDAAQVQIPAITGEVVGWSPSATVDTRRQAEFIEQGSKVLARSADPAFTVAEIPLVCAALVRDLGYLALAKMVANLELKVRCPVCEQVSQILAAIQNAAGSSSC